MSRCIKKLLEYRRVSQRLVITQVRTAASSTFNITIFCSRLSHCRDTAGSNKKYHIDFFFFFWNCSRRRDLFHIYVIYPHHWPYYPNKKVKRSKVNSQQLPSGMERELDDYSRCSSIHRRRITSIQVKVQGPGHLTRDRDSR